MKINIKDIILESSKDKEIEAQNTNMKNAVIGTGAVGLGAAKLGSLAKLGTIIKNGSGATIPIVTEGDWKKSAIHSGIASGLGTLAANSIGNAFGSGVPIGAIGVAAGTAALKGGALGAIAGRGRDTLFKSGILPAGVVAASAPITNSVMDAAGYPDIEADPVISSALTGGLGSLFWYLRNKKNKNKHYF